MTTSLSNTAPIDARSRLMVALDVPTSGDARRIVDQLGDRVEIFKVGLELFTGTGLEFVRELQSRKKRIFLDLKVFDVGETVKRTVKVVVDAGVSFLTIHGNSEIVSRGGRSPRQQQAQTVVGHRAHLPGRPGHSGSWIPVFSAGACAASGDEGARGGLRRGYLFYPGSQAYQGRNARRAFGGYARHSASGRAASEGTAKDPGDPRSAIENRSVTWLSAVRLPLRRTLPLQPMRSSRRCNSALALATERRARGAG